MAGKWGANFIVQGRIQRTSDNLQVSTVLYDVSERWDLWEEQFRAGSKDILSVEDRIFSRLAGFLQPRNLNQISTWGSHSVPDVEAYDLYLKGRNAVRYQQARETLRLQ